MCAGHPIFVEDIKDIVKPPESGTPTASGQLASHDSFTDGFAVSSDHDWATRRAPGLR